MNPHCPYRRTGWLRLRRPEGILLNKSWLCSWPCFEEASVQLLSSLDLTAQRGRNIRYRLPLGLLLVSKRIITGEELQDALQAQTTGNKNRIGALLRDQGVLSEEQLTAALAAQWGLPVLRLAQINGFEECSGMAPLAFLEASRMVLVHYSATSRMLYAAFSRGIDFRALRALEQIYDCATQPGVISECEMEELLEAMKRLPRPTETVLDFPGELTELGAMIRDWAEQNDATSVRAAVSSEHLWLWIQGTDHHGHLLFRLPAESAEPVTSVTL